MIDRDREKRSVVPLAQQYPGATSEDQARRRATERALPQLIIVDSQLEVICDSLASARSGSELLTADRKRLVPDLSDAVRDLIAFERSGHTRPVRGDGRVWFLDSERFIRVTRLFSHLTELYAVSLEVLRSGNSFDHVVQRFGLTSREAEILRHILEGVSAKDSAGSLGISEHTVREYYKRLLRKIGAPNRTVMVAIVLEWDRRR